MIIEGWHGSAVHDGNSFRVDSESPSFHRKLIDSDGDYWYGGPHGQLILKQKNGTVDSSSIKPYVERNINSIHEDNGKFFIVTNDGILLANKTQQGVKILQTIRTSSIDTWVVKTVGDTLYLRGIHNNQYYLSLIHI